MPRPSTPRLSPDRIRAAALRILDEEGLAALSMRRLAEALGVRAASLYNHVRTKEALLNEVANAIVAEVDPRVLDADDWRDAVLGWARAYRAALAAHPNIVPFLAREPLDREASLRLADAVHGTLVRAGWPPRQATMIGAAVRYLVLGAALGSFAGGFVDDEGVYAERFPNLGQAHRLRAHADEIDRDSFELALRALVDGLAARHPSSPDARAEGSTARAGSDGEPRSAATGEPGRTPPS
ncbi:transcriptional regulator, TetR family [Streptoalloteichus tenebrarius]|uniref:Transcriptional regulator, TetR family n=1 Tax=Streptoalloteichus tenebrarius (strain ATCC 17920 / DSM 40477 / JCM 4838 / CBS 697.72 / NBRC 16177 / NCIMB 11028 / NRRL B-12390 / A12253. 1 / ISP 5477) TaxID=1933 RepID=A0ABT1HQD6_STRSD|nr:TetR/AcrR family transcriptional regulator [Streptoalloteichus tenebrarius]MCP2257732.1 transcriptional regulator, TetR family [Streptoalloteichus tenebrarius]